MLERLGLAPRLDAVGAQRNRIAIWTRWGWIQPEPDSRSSRSPYGYNVRRQTLDPMLRELAASTRGVQVRQGFSATGVLRDDARPPAVPGLALIGDAAMASDPLWGVGCGFALRSAEWLVDATAGALGARDGLDRALARTRASIASSSPATTS